MYVAKKYLLTIALMVFVSYPAQAVLYEQTPPDQNINGISTNYDYPVAADDFVLSQDSTVTEVIWYGYYSSTDLDSGISSADFNIDFFSDDSGSPYSLPGSLKSQQTVTALLTDTGLDSNGTLNVGRTIYEFTATLSSSVSIGASEKTWLSIVENDPATVSWLWSRYNNEHTAMAYGTSSGGISSDWGITGGNLAFSLDGTVVPVPGAFLLGMLGLSVAGVKLRKYT